MENIININEYIRTKNGKIRKLISTVAQYYITDKLSIMEDNQYEIQNIKKHSKNIIDLIEVGDYVNGHKVTDVMSGSIYIHQPDVGTVLLYDDYQIKSIVTREAMKSVEYTIE